MTCMCGDTQCPSCGPAQGNYRCIICGKWADDCCEHLTATGKYKKKYRALVSEMERQEAEAEYLLDLAERNEP